MANNVNTVEDALHRLEEFAAVVAYVMCQAADEDDALDRNVCHGLYEICDEIETMARWIYLTLEAESISILSLDLVDVEEDDDE